MAAHEAVAEVVHAAEAAAHVEVAVADNRKVLRQKTTGYETIYIHICAVNNSDADKCTEHI